MIGEDVCGERDPCFLDPLEAVTQWATQCCRYHLRRVLTDTLVWGGNSRVVQILGLIPAVLFGISAASARIVTRPYSHRRTPHGEEQVHLFTGLVP